MSFGINPLTFPRSQAKYDENVFKKPPAEYRGAPLWCWNTRLQEDRLLRQIDQLAEMGMGGFHIHSRIGLDTPYLGPEFMDLVKACVNRARERKMLACLYDEDRWPSGAAGGLVTKGHPEFKAQHLLVTPWEYGKAPTGPAKIGGANGKASRSEQGTLITRLEITLRNGKLESYRRVPDGEPSTHSTWYVYVEPNPPSEWYNGDTYIDTFNPKAIERFIETTHEVYHSKLASDFGTVVPCIFTDEPQFAHKTILLKGSDQHDIFMPWSLDMDDTFASQYGSSLIDKLPELIWDPAVDDTRHNTTRYHYHDHICERFVTSFMDTVAKWCRHRGIALIGHMMKEPTLLSQTQALGEAMRCYRNLDMPGIDMLSDLMEYNTAKQASSVARQNGAKGIMSEIYGVTNWTFDFAGHMAAGNWQAALGVVFRVHHLSWVSMAGEAKRDYPAAIGYQSPWYKEYPYIEDYFARVGVSLTRGKARTRVAVIHPIESYWLCFGPMQTSGQEQAFRDQAFEDLTTWLLHGLIDFDFISESLFPEQTPLDTIVSGAPLQVGHCAYDVIILPYLQTIRSSTLERLQKFTACRGTVIVAGSAPSLVDAQLPTGIPHIPSSKKIEWSSFAVISALEEWRDVRVTSTDDGIRHPKFLYQLRIDEQDQHIFICNTDKKRWYPTSVEVRGEWDVTILDALKGDTWQIARLIENGWTSFKWHFEPCASVLALLTPVSGIQQNTTTLKPQAVLRGNLKTVDIVTLKSIELSEPNVLVLDYPEYQVNDGPWENREEILRVENIVRRRFHLPQKLEAFRQPWSVPLESRQRQVSLKLRFEVNSQTDVPSPKLALENAETTKIRVNGEDIPSKVAGWWVDEDIRTVVLPSLKKEKNIIELESDFHVLTNIERVYLLGDFEVDIRGTSCTLLPTDVSRVEFGNWCIQGYPFYAGNVTYNCEITPSFAGEYFLQVPRFAGPVVTVDLDGKRIGTIALQPHIVDLGTLEKRGYKVSITCYGNRENSFGTLHLPDGCTKWFAPNAWRSEHDWWMEGYNVKPMGILQRPQLKTKGKEISFVNRNPEKLWLI